MNQVTQSSWLILGYGKLVQKFLPLLIREQQSFLILSRSKKNLEFDEQHKTFTFPSHQAIQTLSELSAHKKVLISIPPLMGQFENSIENWQQIIHSISEQAKSVSFISSTSVYSGMIGTINDETLPAPQSERGKFLLSVENLLLDKFLGKDVPIRIFRAGGLFDEEHHPVKYMGQNRTSIALSGKINLIHREDLARAILHSDKLSLRGSLNVVYPYHPAKNEYYAKMAEHYQIDLKRADSIDPGPTSLEIKCPRLRESGLKFHHHPLPNLSK